MEYKKKIKRHIGLFVGYGIIGIVLAILNYAKIIENDFFMSFGGALVIAAIVRIIQYVRIIKNDEIMKRREIAEKDERNIMINNKAKSWAFYFYILAAAVAVIVFAILRMETVMLVLAYSVCAMVFIYWICYHIIKRKF